MVSFPQVSPPQPCAHLSPPAYAPYDPVLRLRKTILITKHIRLHKNVSHFLACPHNHLNVILPSVSGSSKRSLSNKFSHKNSVCQQFILCEHSLISYYLVTHPNHEDFYHAKCKLLNFWGLRTSGMWHDVIWQTYLDIQEQPVVSIIKCPDDRGSRFLCVLCDIICVSSFILPGQKTSKNVSTSSLLRCQIPTSHSSAARRRKKDLNLMTCAGI